MYVYFQVFFLRQILAIRAQVEELEIDEESLAFLGEIGQRASLRY
jgi:RuvB-like protein 1